RNRIIAALAEATLICEAGLPSGTFGAADDALDLGKEVWAIPGSIFAKQSAGANQLISQGALMVNSMTVFCEALDRIAGPGQILTDPFINDAIDQESEDFPESVRVLLATLRAGQFSAEELSLHLGQEILPLLRQLSRLELAGQVERGRDGRYHLTRL
ncbi:MAG: DNA-processing protein DprA, partial [Coriobacteriales bacterium]|nr:DNA-processing protein DprA [Coriobacteriales bacterium]